MTNKFLAQSKKNKNDEFYTRIEDIEKELIFYRDHFNNSVVYCNCDNVSSSFPQFLSQVQEDWGIKKIIATGLNHFNNIPVVYTKLYGKEPVITPSQCNGEYRSEESLSFLQEADIIVTNPPFSLFRDFFDLLTQYEKKFLVIANINAFSYKNVAPYIIYDKIWTGMTQPSNFYTPEGELKKLNNVCWITNIKPHSEKDFIPLCYSYNPNNYHFIENYNALEVPKYKLIPYDYNNIMAVPITFLHYYNEKQFEIVGISGVKGAYKEALEHTDQSFKTTDAILHGKKLYKRVFIKKKSIIDNTRKRSYE